MSAHDTMAESKLGAAYKDKRVQLIHFEIVEFDQLGNLIYDPRLEENLVALVREIVIF